MANPFADLRGLDGKIVLVKSAKDTRNPPTAMRGTINVKPSSRPGDHPAVCVVLEFPDMFNVPAHDRTLSLDDGELHQLLSSERNGTYELTMENELDGASGRSH